MGKYTHKNGEVGSGFALNMIKANSSQPFSLTSSPVNKGRGKQDRKVRKAQKKLIKARELMAEGRAMTEGGGWIEQPTKSARRSWRTVEAGGGTVGLPDYETIDTGVEPTKAFSGKTDTQTYGVGPKTEKKGQKKIKKARRKQTKAQKKLKKVNVDHTLEKEAEVFGK